MRNKRRNFFAYISQFKKDGDGGEGGSSGGQGSGEGSAGGTTAIDKNSEEFKSAVRDAVDSQVSGLKQKNDDLLGTINEQKSKLKDFDGLDAAKIRNMMTHFENNEEAQLIAEGKIDDVIQRRTDKISGQYTDQINQLSTSLESLTAERDNLHKQLERSVIGNKLQAEAAKSGILPEAVEDVLMRGLGVFSLDDKNEIVARDKDGNLRKMEDGMLLNPERFIESLRKSNPYYWPSSQSAGGRGSLGPGQSSRDQLDTLTDVATSGNFDLNAYRAAKGKK